MEENTLDPMKGRFNNFISNISLKTQLSSDGNAESGEEMFEKTGRMERIVKYAVEQRLSAGEKAGGVVVMGVFFIGRLPHF